MNNETLKTSNERRLSREEAKSYLSIFYLLCIHREQWACLAFCFHTTASSARGCSSWDERTIPIGTDVSEYIRTMTCITASYFSMPFDSLVQPHIQARKLWQQSEKKQVKTFLVLAQFLLNQLAGNKAGFCSLLKGAEQHKESSHLLLAFCGNASVPVSPSFSDTERQLTRQLELCSLRLHVQRESPQFLLHKHIINDTVLPACTDKRLYPINFEQLRFLAKNIR